MEMMGRVRRMKLRDGISNSEIAKRTGLSRNTVKKPRWPVEIPPPVATPNSPRQDRSDYDDSWLRAMREAASLSR